MRSTVLCAALALASALPLGPAAAAPIPWSGHLYEAVNAGEAITWDAARAAAQAAGGDLVSITSGEENAFVFGAVAGDPALWRFIATDASYSGPWIGAYHAGPGMADWAWVSGEEWAYSAWQPGQPNQATGWALLWSPTGPEGTWGDISAEYPEWNPASYVVEWNTPEPATLALVGIGTAAVAARRRRRAARTTA